MKKWAFVFLVLAISFHANAQKLTLLWKSDTTLRVPESVLFDSKSNKLYVSSIEGKSDAKDGNGFISILSTDGKIENLKWAAGLDAPKGMALVKNTLVVADLTAVVLLDAKTGKTIKKIEIEGAQFLNDAAALDNGDVVISDSGTGRIHLIKDQKASLYFESQELNRVNGLLAIKEGLYVADAGTGINYKLSKDKKLTKFTETSAGADGIVQVGKDGFIVSSWGGEIYFVAADGKATKMLDTKEQKLNTADIAFDEKTSTLFVPTFFGNTVMAYRFEK